MPDLRLGNVFQLPRRRISRRWTRRGTNLVNFLEALCEQTNLFWREMKILMCFFKCILKSRFSLTWESRNTNGNLLIQKV